MKLRIKYPNLTLLAASILVAIALAYFNIFEMALGDLGSFGYIGAFVAGVLFPITFTSPVAAFAFFYLGGHYNLLGVTVLGGIGAVLGDLLIFTFIKDGTIAEIEKIREKYDAVHRKHPHYRHRHKAFVELFHNRLFHALALFLAGLFILLPGPDEFGVAVFASYGVDMKKFIPLSLLLNTVSIGLVTFAGKCSLYVCQL